MELFVKNINLRNILDNNNNNIIISGRVAVALLICHNAIYIYKAQEEE